MNSIKLNIYIYLNVFYVILLVNFRPMTTAAAVLGIC